MLCLSNPWEGGGGLGWAAKENLMVQRKTPSKNFPRPLAGGRLDPILVHPPHPRGVPRRLGWKSWLAGWLAAAKQSSVFKQQNFFIKPSNI